MMPPNNPPLASVRAMEAAAARYRALSQPGMADEIEAGEQDDNPLVQTLTTVERTLLDEIEGRVKGLLTPEILGRSSDAEPQFTNNQIIRKALAAIKELRHGRS